MQELLSTVSSIALKTSDKNTRTRALWVISKQTFPSEIVGKEVSFLILYLFSKISLLIELTTVPLFPQVPSIISTLEMILTKGDVHSMVVEYEALNVIIRYVASIVRFLEQLLRLFWGLSFLGAGRNHVLNKIC